MLYIYIYLLCTHACRQETLLIFRVRKTSKNKNVPNLCRPIFIHYAFNGVLGDETN